uniref:MarR family transcriptional regulator n=1 Tax=Pararhizobium sp. IMCC3301 TaxID=3067904 RepID=UPI00274066EC|nr:helix-turn-helix domain-containing protein [Pararhizobium sp. IMCC3301]
MQVLEYLMAAGSRPVKQVEIARDCGIAPATLNRIVQALSERGYVFRTSEKYCVPNFRLERTVPMSEQYREFLEREITSLAHDLGVSAEGVVVAGNELLWLSCKPHPNPDVQIRAKVGFRRGLYELDALSQLYLAQVPENELVDRFFLEGFYTTEFDGVRRMRMLSEADARALIKSAAGIEVAADDAPNHQGIRRFATAVTRPDGEFLHLISIADKVCPDGDQARLAERYRERLSETRERLCARISAEFDPQAQKYVSLAQSSAM